MRHSLPQSHQFYVTAPQPCPYLPGKVERKLFTALQGDGACHLNDVLSHQGFRRSQNVLYRPSCAGCSACLSARIVVADFAPDAAASAACCAATPSSSASPRSPWATEAQYALFRRYLDARHATGGMADMDMSEFAAMIEEMPGPQPGDRILPPGRRARPAPAGRGLPDRHPVGRGVDGLFLLRPRPAARRASAATSSSTTSRIAAECGCRTSTSATGCRAAPRWTTRPASSRSRSSPTAAGAGSADTDASRARPPPRRPRRDQRAGRRDRAPLDPLSPAPARGSAVLGEARAARPPLGRRLAVGRLCGLPPKAGIAG